MICDISNAYPSNIAVDAGHNVQFKFVFYGDGCTEADILIYDSTNSSVKPQKLSKNLYDARRTYYNGEEIDANTNGGSIGGGFINGHSYIWKVRMFEDVSIGSGKYPTVKRMGGETVAPPFIFGKIQNPLSIPDDTHIYIEKNLEINLPMWMRIGTDETYRILKSYDVDTGEVVLKNAFAKYPSPGSSYSLTSVKKIVPKELDSNQLCIGKGITELAEAEFQVERNSQTIYPWYLEIGNQYSAITAYDSKTGIITLDTGVFSEEEVGTKYNLWTSFIDSRFYAITTKESPRFTSVLGCANGENILFEAELSEGHAVKYYWLDIYEGENLVETTGKIFMSKLSYYYRKARPGRKYHAVFHVVTQDGMTNQEDTIWWKSGTPTNKTDECSLVSISQNVVGGVATYFDSAKQAMRITALGKAVATGTLKSGNRVDLSSFYIDPGLSISAANKVVLFGDGCAYEVKSYDSSTGKLVIKAPASKYYAGGEKYTICADKPESSCYYKVLRTGDDGTSYAGSYKTNVVYDYMCESGASYTYVVLPYKINTQNVSEEKKIANYYPESTVDVVVPKKKCWAIYGLLPTAYTRITNDDTRIFYGYQDQFSEYSIDEVWLAELDIDPTHSVTHNINRAVYTGNQPMPVAVAGSNSYDSFSLTFSIGSIECPGNKVRLGTIKDIKQWKEFIAKGELTMLKDPDGNVWVGAITSHTYDKVHYGNIVEYKVTFEFTEIKSATSPISVDAVGRRAGSTIETSMGYSDQRCKEFAEYWLKEKSIITLSVNIESAYLPHLDVDKNITLESDGVADCRRFIITSITMPFGSLGSMTLSATNIVDLLYYNEI